MKKYLLYVSLILTLIFLFSYVDSDALCRKKKKKQTTTNTTPAADSTGAIRAPGVKNQRELDSIKNSRVKQRK